MAEDVKGGRRVWMQKVQNLVKDLRKKVKRTQGQGTPEIIRKREPNRPDFTLGPGGTIRLTEAHIHGEEDEDSDGELIGEEEGADDRREHVGCGIAVFLKKENCPNVSEHSQTFYNQTICHNVNIYLKTVQKQISFLENCFDLQFFCIFILLAQYNLLFLKMQSSFLCFPHIRYGLLHRPFISFFPLSRHS